MKSTTGTLGKLMSVLDVIVSAEDPPRFSALLTLTGEPRGTLHRHLSHLVDEGLVEMREDGRYRAGLRLLKLAAKSWASNDIRRVARPHLEALHEATGETVHLGILKGAEIVYLDKVEGRQAIRMYSQVGNAAPAYCTGIGKAALAALTDESLECTIAGIDFKPFTSETIVDARALSQSIEETRRSGFAYDLEEHEQGIRCIAAPLSIMDGMVGGISVTAPAYRADMERLGSWQAVLARIAGDINRELEARLGPG